MRLQKYLAHSGIASRRKCEQYILDGRVIVNGILVQELGMQVHPDRDRIEFDNKEISIPQNKIYILLNKPVGYVSTVRDPSNRKTILDIIRSVDERIYPIGRLDYDSEGLILLTNDGGLTYKLTHPKHGIEKEYIAVIQGIPSQKEIIAFKNGLVIDGYRTSQAGFKRIKINQGNTLVQITIHEGRNRQIRKMCDAIGHPVISLKRIRIGEIYLGDLPLGKWRFLTKGEVQYLKSI